MQILRTQYFLSEMAAPLVRNIRAFGIFGNKIAQIRQQKLLFLASRAASGSKWKGTEVDQDPFHYHDNTVPYFPEESAKKSLEAEYPDVEISTEDWHYVERVLPPKTVPEPPQHESYPTASGWLPPNTSLQPKEYGIVRTRNHMLPLYYRKHFHGKETTRILHIVGDIWKFKKDVHDYLTKEKGVRSVDIQVHEVGRFLRFRGNHLENVAEFLLQKGF
ncbi:39S ribosomal protein L49, mitochondrial-like [Dreissena polymorpha]|nr:39S ribosomal protein L49, mitochondrial-like [Dreissena polymorpha]